MKRHKAVDAGDNTYLVRDTEDDKTVVIVTFRNRKTEKHRRKSVMNKIMAIFDKETTE